MKITIAPSEDQTGMQFPSHSISVESPNDDIKIPEAVNMFVDALKGWGYDMELIQKELSEFEF
jgi:hypothetical protein